MWKSANVGPLDRMLRIAAAIGLAAYATTALVAPWSFVAYAVAAVLLVTAVARFCPAYRLLGMNTCNTAR